MRIASTLPFVRPPRVVNLKFGHWTDLIFGPVDQKSLYIGETVKDANQKRIYGLGSVALALAMLVNTCNNNFNNKKPYLDETGSQKEQPVVIEAPATKKG